MKPKRELIRVARSPEGAVSLDATGKAPGRGAYICPEAACFMRAQKSRALARALGAEVSADIYESILGAVNERSEVSDGT
jgi:predicted RNA-binding protein YlxR (DUF448 family)